MTPNEAYKIVRAAIRRGDLVRPDQCSKCLSIPEPASDGRSNIQGHHADYSKPLDVEWLCAKCHRAVTPLPDVMGAPTYGTRNGSAQLNESAVIDILTSKLSSRQIAAKYGVDKRTVLRVRNGETWKSIC